MVRALTRSKKLVSWKTISRNCEPMPLAERSRYGGKLARGESITTVEIACLKINCSWLLVSSTTEYLSNDRMRPVSFTPLSK